MDDPDSIFNCYRRLIELRKEYPVFVDGEYRLLLEDDESIFAYERKNADQTLLVVCNFFGETVDMPLADKCQGMEILISNYGDADDAGVLRPYEARMYIR